MANEKNVTEKIEETEKSSALKKAIMSGGDPYADRRGGELAENTVVESEGSETVFSGTDTYLYVSTNQSKDKKGEMRTWYNFRMTYRIYIGDDENGDPVYHQQFANFTPISRDKGDSVFDVLSFMFKKDNKYPADIVKMVRTINDEEIISYTLRLSYTTPLGGILDYSFKPVVASDKEMFSNYIKNLVKFGIIK